MISQQVTSIALRALAIWLLVQVILNSSGVILLLNSSEIYRNESIPIEVYSMVLIGFYVMGFAAVYLINKLAGSILGRAKSEETTTKSLSKDSEKFLLQLLGAYFLVDALVSIPRTLSFVIHVDRVDVTQFFWPAGLVVQLIIGFFLIGCSKYWLRVLEVLRGRGGL